MSFRSKILRKKSVPILRVFSIFSQTNSLIHSRKWGKFSCVFFVFLFFASVPQYLMAGLIVQAGSAQVNEGQSGYIDVFFHITEGTTQTYDLSMYQVEIGLTGPTSKVLFNQFAEAAYAIFPGSVPAQTLSGPALPGMIAAANDMISGSNTIVDNAGIMRVFFGTELGSAGDYTVTIDSNPAHTSFADGNADPITPANYVSGSITVKPVPEPADILILISLLPFFALFKNVAKR